MKSHIKPIKILLSVCLLFTLAFSAQSASAAPGQAASSTPITLPPVASVGANSTMIKIAAGKAYVAFGSQFAILDLTHPDAPAQLGAYLLPNDVRDFDLKPPLAYLVTVNALFAIINISDAAHPYLVGQLDLSSYEGTLAAAPAVAVKGAYAYVVCNNTNVSGPKATILTVDISNPAHPQSVGTYDSWNVSQYQLLIVGNYLYVATFHSIYYLSLADPLNLKFENGGSLSSDFTGNRPLFLDGNTLYAPEPYDVTDPGSPVRTSVDFGLTWADGVALANGVYFAYQDQCYGSCPISFYVRSASNPGSFTYDYSLNFPIYAMAAYQNRIYATTYYWGGLAILDISNPANVQAIQLIDTPGASAGLALAGTHMVTAETNAFGRHRLNVIDISQRLSPQWLGYFDLPAAIIDYAVAGSLVYALASDGLHIIDVSTPGSFHQVGADATLSQGSSSNKIMVYQNAVYVFYTDASHAPIVENVGDPAHPAQAGTISGVTGAGISSVKPAGLYSHYLYLTNGHLVALDLSNPLAPVAVYSVNFFSSFSSFSALGSYAYITYDNQIGRLDLTQPSNPQLLTYPNQLSGVYQVSAVGQWLFLLTSQGLQVFSLDEPLHPQFKQTYLVPAVSSMAVNGHDVYLPVGTFALYYVDYHAVYVPMVMNH